MNFKYDSEALKKEVEILTKIDTFNKSNAYLEIKGQETERKEVLNDFTDRSLVSIAGKFVLDFVESEYKGEKEPEILIEANKLFSLFTNGKYSLKFKEDGRLYKAYLKERIGGFAFHLFQS